MLICLVEVSCKFSYFFEYFSIFRNSKYIYLGYLKTFSKVLNMCFEFIGCQIMCRNCRRFDPGGVPGPTSKLSPRAPAQMGRRETEREGGRSRRETGVKGETRGLRVCPAPRSGALAVGGYKRPRGREREAYARAVPSFPARPTFCKRALDLPFIAVRRGSRYTMGDVAAC
jgi:hypothetical protein